MPAPKGNRFWEARSSHGRKPIEGKMDKYPVSHTYLPANFAQKPTDNDNLLKIDGEIFADMLRPNSLACGINKRSSRPSTVIGYGEIYVLWAVGTTLFKIGVSSDFNRRYRDLTSSSPLPLQVMKYAHCDNPHLLERHLHNMFADKLFKNEWFSLDQNDWDQIQAVFDKYFERQPQAAA